MLAFKINTIFDFFIEKPFPMQPRGGIGEAKCACNCDKNCVYVPKYMHQSVANTAQLAPGTNLIRILKYFKKSCFFFIFFQKNENHAAKYFAGAANFH